jgi:hypothetical protein
VQQACRVCAHQDGGCCMPSMVMPSVVRPPARAELARSRSVVRRGRGSQQQQQQCRTSAVSSDTGYSWGLRLRAQLAAPYTARRRGQQQRRAASRGQPASQAVAGVPSRPGRAARSRQLTYFNTAMHTASLVGLPAAPAWLPAAWAAVDLRLGTQQHMRVA